MLVLQLRGKSLARELDNDEARAVGVTRKDVDFFFGKKKLEDERRYSVATLIQIAAIPVVFAAPRVAVSIALLCVGFFLLPQPKPRYKPGEEPSREEKTNE